MTVRAIALGLSMTLLTAGATVAAPASRIAPCQALVNQLQQRDAGGKTVRGFNLSSDQFLEPLVTLAKRSQPSAELDAQLARLTTDWDGQGGKDLQQIDTTTWRAVLTQGTLDCENEVFFRRNADGRLERLPAPAVYSELCWTSGRSMASFGGRPVLLEREILDRPTIGADIEMTPWIGNWGDSCSLSVRYDDVFRLAETFCHDAKVCRAGGLLAPKLARAFAHAHGNEIAADAVAPLSGRGRRALGSLEVLYSKIPREEQSSRPVLATFGAKSRTEFPDYSDAMTAIGIEIGGKPLLAIIGIGGVGWRAMGDYLVTLYRWDGSALHAVAGYVIERRVGKLIGATTSIPTPYVNPH